LDVGSVLLDKDGKPRHELFEKDGLHLSPAGYELWSEKLLPLLKKQRRRGERLVAQLPHPQTSQGE
jgi:lysophospholipase L1-like esterase